MSLLSPNLMEEISPNREDLILNIESLLLAWNAEKTMI